MNKITLYRALLETVRELREEESGMVIRKATNGLLIKAWHSDDRTYLEGWGSTDHEDRELDDIPPEAFLHVIGDYFQRHAPLCLNHEPLQVGHLQKAALVRDGRIFRESIHPDDAADFEHFPGSGTGVYARAAITHPQASDAIQKATAGGFSFAGRAKTRIRKPNGGWHIVKMDSLDEFTLAVSPAIPVNPHARIISTS